ncbi:MAG TPA: YfbM family protein [Candidatus Nitrosotalea sp.]|nr:YfbM family protein [Candidatus Nitrosotalea sp.]
MSMTATLVRVSTDELSQFERDPSLVEPLFEDGSGVVPDDFLKLSKTMEDRVKAAGPQMLVEGLARLDPRLKERLAERLGKSPDEWARSLQGDDLLKMMQERRARLSAGNEVARKTHPTLSLDKAWHGVHYILCGETEPGATPLSQAILGGTALGDEDDEGFSGYGPARYFTASQVAEIAHALNDPVLESQAAARFDPEKMAELEIYPGWRASDAESLLNALRQLRDFYAKAAADGDAIVTCIV